MKDIEIRENLLAVSVYELEKVIIITKKSACFECLFINLNKEFDIFELELKFTDEKHVFSPVLYLGKLVLGILLSIVSTCFLLHMY